MPIQASDVVRFSRQMTRLYTTAFTPIMEQYDISMREVHVIVFLANNPQFDTAKDIVQRRGLLKSQVSQGVDTLCNKQLLQRVPDEIDRRCTHLRFTTLGAQLGKQTQALQADWWSRMMDLFTDEEKIQTQHLLEKWLTAADTLEAHV